MVYIYTEPVPSPPFTDTHHIYPLFITVASLISTFAIVTSSGFHSAMWLHTADIRLSIKYK